METISFTIPFGDTSDPRKIAADLANDLSFKSWMLEKSSRVTDDEGIAATLFTVKGWTDSLEDENTGG